MTNRKKNEYLVTIPVKSATGRQEWLAKAESAEEAIRLIRDGGGEFVSEEITVTDLNFSRAEAEVNE